jgi:hypothetical protein
LRWRNATAALLGEKCSKYNNGASGGAMLPALYSWRDELAPVVVRLLALAGAAVLLSIMAAMIFQEPSVPGAPSQPRSAWIEIERPFPAFALSIPEAADVPAHYAIRRHAIGGGRKDILSLGEPDNAAPYLEVQIYRPGSEIADFADPVEEIGESASAFAPTDVHRQEALDSKFGPLAIVTFKTAIGTPRGCLAFTRAYDDPRLQLSGWFCQGGDLIERSTLACALDRLTLLAAGSEPKVGALFAQAELKRSFCGQRDPILASTPKYTLLWKALATRPEPRRIGR